MKRFLVALLAVVLMCGGAFAETYTYNDNHNFNKDVAMVNAVAGFLLGAGSLYRGSASGGATYYGRDYGGAVGGYNDCGQPAVTAPPPQCVWLPIWQNNQIIGYQPVCR